MKLLSKFAEKFSLVNKFVVPRPNQGGGLALLWKEEIKVNVQISSDNHIDVVVDKGMDDTWQITGFYGNPDSVSREDSWSLIRD